MTRFSCLVGLAFASAALPAVADNPRGIVAVTVENDVFTGSDDSYSNGIGLTWVSREASLYSNESFVDNWTGFWSFLPGTQGPNTQTYVSFSVAQEIHTPEDIARIIPDPNDQPYAGLLYADSSIYTLRENWVQAWSFRLGVVGPASFADSTQKNYHKLIGVTDPLGWDSQIQNEPVINVSYTLGREIFDQPLVDNSSLRVSAIGSIDAGTYITAAGGGLLVELGWNMPDALAIGGVGNALSATTAIGAEYEENWSVSSYLGVGGYAIGHLLPLDGPVFRDGPSIGSDDFATVINTGVAVRKGNFIGSFGIAYGASPGDKFDEELDFGRFVFAWQF